MDINSIAEDVWSDVVTGKINCEFDFLALKILISSLKLRLSFEKNPEAVRKASQELKNLFVKFGHLPAATSDLEKILKQVRVS
jgi:hypothetical protein